MIACLTGTVIEVSGGICLLDVNGVGFEIRVPLPAMEDLAAAAGEIRLHTFLHVREDGVQLFGFLRREEKKVFEKIIAVSGIGPKTALSVLSVLTVERIRQAVEGEDYRLLASVPGVGQKTAQRLVLELRGKLGAFHGTQDEAANAGQTGNEAADAIEALVALGYPSPAAVQAVEAALSAGEGPAAPSLVRAALKRLAR